MKANHLILLPVILVLTGLAGNAQEAIFNPHTVKHIPFGKKLPPPEPVSARDEFLPELSLTAQSGGQRTLNMYNSNPQKKDAGYFRQLLLDKRKARAAFFQPETLVAKKGHEGNTNSHFNLLWDINALAESNPRNSSGYVTTINADFFLDSVPFAVLNDVVYFAADDGIHGSELWRSDGTDAGTYLLKDIQAGASSSSVFNICASNGKIYFNAYAPGYGFQPWVSDGTEAGTQMLMLLAPGGSEPTGFFPVGKDVYFIVDGLSYQSAIWKTDGTPASTTQVIDIGGRGSGGEQIMQPTLVNGILFFTFLNYDNFGWELWRSDGTDAGTYRVGALYADYLSIPAQLTNYDNKLYFSASDGTGRKLWVSDGTDAGTIPAPGNHDVLISGDYLGTSFPILNGSLLIPGEETAGGQGLYKYNASNTAGLVKIRDLAPPGDTALIIPSEMKIVHHTLYFKVTSSASGTHDELWSSGGTWLSTKPVQKFLPGETIRNIYNGNDICYFVKSGGIFGTELWRTLNTYFGEFPILVSDVFKGATGSYPAYLTAFKGKLVFAAADEKKGYELFMTGGNAFNTNLVKDINTVATKSSNAGFNFSNGLGYKGMAEIGDQVLFNAYERVHGYELYKSDGTPGGTELLNDVVPGEDGFNVQEFISKNNAVYFIAQLKDRAAIYKTNGNKKGLKKITPDYSSIPSFAVTNNGLVFYTIYNSSSSLYELWRSDGTGAGTYLLSPAAYNLSYLTTIGNMALFVAGDAMNGNELWKSDGSLAGTTLVRDINPGSNGSYPAGMFPYKNEVYFSAEDGTSANPSFWKSNGTQAGTIKLKEIDPFWGNTVASTARYFGISNNILYFSAIDHNDLNGTQFWRTDGTVAGTQVVKDINPTSGSAARGPFLLTDVNGTLFFTANDGVHGNEVWKSNGTADGTLLVSDLTPGLPGSTITGLTGFSGKLYFQNAVNNRYYLWESDGTEAGTHVEDTGIVNVGIASIFAAAHKLYLSGNTPTYGTELYVGNMVCQSGRLAMTKAVFEKVVPLFDATLYPNPAVSGATLKLTGPVKNVSVIIMDIDGKKLWQTANSNAGSLNLPVERFAAGIYSVIVTSDIGSRTLKLVKQ